MFFSQKIVHNLSTNESKNSQPIYVQWKPLNGITDNGINRKIESKIYKSQIPLSYLTYVEAHLLIGLSLCLSVFLSLCLSAFLSFCLSAFLPFCLSAFLSFFLSFSLSFCLSVFLSLCHFCTCI